MIELLNKINPRHYTTFMLVAAVSALWFKQVALMQEIKKCPDDFTEYLKVSNVHMIEALDRNSEALERHTETIELLKR